jgi:hypothetical protein
VNATLPVAQTSTTSTFPKKLTAAVAGATYAALDKSVKQAYRAMFQLRMT